MKNHSIALILAVGLVASSSVACDSPKSATGPSDLPSANGSSDSFVLSGTVTSGDGGAEPVAGAAVTAFNGTVTRQVVTNAAGAFEFQGLNTGRWIVRVTRPDQGALEQIVALSTDIYPTFLVEGDGLTVLFSVLKSGRAIPR
jgi:hypothetical protein